MEIELYYTPHTRAGRVRWLLEELQLPLPAIYTRGILVPGNVRSSSTALLTSNRCMIASSMLRSPCHRVTNFARPRLRDVLLARMVNV